MKVYRTETVWDAALDRIRWVFGEFEHVVVNTSGGKDSTVILELALIVARELGRLPLPVMFVDQEAEWQATVDTVRQVMDRPEVEPLWLQVPIRLFNATSSSDHWLNCWAPEDEHRWMRPKEPDAITDNVYGTDRFAKLFPAFLAERYGTTPACYLTGIRTEESPARLNAMSNARSYKWATWGSWPNKKLPHHSFCPIYDWAFADVWKAIHDNAWPYNPLYDWQYAHGIPMQRMRVSNVHHETAVHDLFYMQEIEPETWSRLTQRIAGVDSASKLAADFLPRELPFMFATWREYRDYLLDRLIERPEWRESFRGRFARQEARYGHTVVATEMYRHHVWAILRNDWEQITLNNWEVRTHVYAVRKQETHAG